MMPKAKIRRMLNTALLFVAAGVMIVTLIGIAIGGWYITRGLHYRLSYKTMVEKTVREMVKPEALRGEENGQADNE